MTQHSLDTTGWLEFPFDVNGTTYVSKLAPNSPFVSRVKFLPKGTFESMNKSAVLDLIGTELNRETIINKLNYVNENATHAVIELA